MQVFCPFFSIFTRKNDFLGQIHFFGHFATFAPFFHKNAFLGQINTFRTKICHFCPVRENVNSNSTLLRETTEFLFSKKQRKKVKQEQVFIFETTKKKSKSIT